MDGKKRKGMSNIKLRATVDRRERTSTGESI